MTLRTVAHQAPLAMEFSRQEYWSGLTFPSPGDLPSSGMESTSVVSSALAGGFFTTSTTREALEHDKVFNVRATGCSPADGGPQTSLVESSPSSSHFALCFLPRRRSGVMQFPQCSIRLKPQPHLETCEEN